MSKNIRDRLTALEETVGRAKHYHVVSDRADIKKIKCESKDCIAIVIGEALNPKVKLAI